MSDKYTDPKKVIDIVNGVLIAHSLNTLKDERVKTNLGEWSGPCPRCKILHGNGGEDRLRVWPNRPYYQPMREVTEEEFTPVFWCRQCKTERGQDWSGDLLQFLQDSTGMSFGEALKMLDIQGGDNQASDGRIALKTRLSASGAPSELWQKTGIDFVKHSIELLWSDEGAPARRYLMDVRKFTEETLREANIGYQPDPFLFVDGKDWGLAGRMRIYKGIVIPEFHAGLTAHKGDIELWSIAIRRSPAEIREEEAETGKHVARYPNVRGSVKGLYGAESLKRDLPAVLIDGQLDGLTVKQEGHGEFGFGSTCGAKSGGDLLTWAKWLSKPAGWLLCFDPDSAGFGMVETWQKVIKNSIAHVPPVKDLNEMLQQGKDVYGFLQAGWKRYSRVHSIPLVSRQDEQDIPLTDLGNVVSALEIEEVPTVISEPNEAFTFEDIAAKFEKGCEGCGAEPERVTEDGKVYCEACYNKVCCPRCGEPGYYIDALGNAWCRADFAACQLMNEGKKYGFGAIDVPAGSGLVVPVGVGSPHNVEEVVEASLCPAGKSGYLGYCKSAHRAQIWLAASEVHAFNSGYVPPKKPKVAPIKNPCARYQAGCRHDTKSAYQMYPDIKDGQGRLLYPPIKGTVQAIGDKVLRWCGMCFTASLLLQAGEIMHFPALGKIEEGFEAWLQFCTHSSDFEITVAFDNLRRERPKVVDRAQDIMVD